MIVTGPDDYEESCWGFIGYDDYEEFTRPMLDDAEAWYASDQAQRAVTGGWVTI